MLRCDESVEGLRYCLSMPAKRLHSCFVVFCAAYHGTFYVVILLMHTLEYACLCLYQLNSLSYPSTLPSSASVGRFRITGAKTEQDLSEALTKLYPVLMEYRKANVAPMPGLASAPPALPATASAGAGDALEMPPLPSAGGSVPMPAVGAAGTATVGEQREVEDV